MRPKRQGLIVWFKHRRNIRRIRKYGHLIYTSRRLKYALIYVNKDEIEHIESRLQKYKFIKKVEPSYRPFIDKDYSQNRLNQEKVDEFEMGI